MFTARGCDAARQAGRPEGALVSAGLALERWQKLADRHEAVRAEAQRLRQRASEHEDEVGRLEAAMRADTRDAVGMGQGEDGLAYAVYGGREHVPVGQRMELRGVETRVRKPQFDAHVRRIGELKAEIRRLRIEANALFERNAPLARLVSEGRRLLEQRRIRVPPQ